MQVDELRRKHPRLVYKSARAQANAGKITIRYEFVLEPDIIFRPVTTIPFSGSFDEQAFAPFAFHLGMMEAISYWKAAVPAEFVVEAGSLSADQIRFWHDLFIHGLGEFFYQNQIDFTQPGFLTIRSNSSLAPYNNTNENSFDGSHTDLVLVSGGKDSSVTLGLLGSNNRAFDALMVNPTEATKENLKAAGINNPIEVHRQIDPTLLSLIKQGYLNGHTPFSAYLAFLGVAVAALYKNPRVLVSNERSADYGNVIYRGLEVNHQYSKSFRFEQRFRAYVAEYLSGAAEYFSVLRPFNDVQIAMVFATFSQYFASFRSCNVGSKTNVWCGSCAKCAFTYLILYPFMTHEQMLVSFGEDFFIKSEITPFIRELIGLTPVKPFDCVGTPQEAKMALILSLEKYKKEAREIPEELLKIKSDIGLSEADIADLHEEVIDHWSDVFNVPEEYMSLLRAAWGNVHSH
jgi:hypothetical protein